MSGLTVHSDHFKMSVLEAASWMNEPICKVRELFYQFYTLDVLYAWVIERVIIGMLLSVAILLCICVAPIPTLIGTLLRLLVSSCEAKPFVYLARADKGKKLPESKQIKIVNYNICLFPGGYAFTGGQVSPPSDQRRLNTNVEWLKKLDADLICLSEVPDACDASNITSQLPEYPFVIPVAGTRAIGPPSMLYVASKYEIPPDSVHFIAFEKNTELTGESRFSEKGFLMFDLKSQGEDRPFATVVSTHLQHSQGPSTAPESEPDREARTMQLNRIASCIQPKIDAGQNIIFVGDWNMPEAELAKWLESKPANWLRRDPRVEGMVTWGGDAWSAGRLGMRPSPPAVLDYAAVGGKAVSISTKVRPTGFREDRFSLDPLSDHALLESIATLG